jgi:hypothetical protein
MLFGIAKGWSQGVSALQQSKSACMREFFDTSAKFRSPTRLHAMYHATCRRFWVLGEPYLWMLKKVMFCRGRKWEKANIDKNSIIKWILTDIKECVLWFWSWKLDINCWFPVILSKIVHVGHYPLYYTIHSWLIICRSHKKEKPNNTIRHNGKPYNISLGFNSFYIMTYVIVTWLWKECMCFCCDVGIQENSAIRYNQYYLYYR